MKTVAATLRQRIRATGSAGRFRAALARPLIATAVLALGLVVLPAAPRADFVAVDPGPRGGSPGAGGPLPGLSPVEMDLFLAGQETIQEVDSVQGTVPGTGAGLGPRFNMDGCGGCHSHPAPGGASPSVNPQVAVAAKEGATNPLPFFITIDGPIRSPHAKRRVKGVAPGTRIAAFTIAGRADAPGCAIEPFDFDALAADDNLFVRTPLQLFGLGLIEAIPDAAIVANNGADEARKRALGIGGHPGMLAGTVGRFGRKALGTSLLLDAAGGYAGEVGVTNVFLGKEGDPDPACHFNTTPEDVGDPHASTLADRLPDFAKIALFVRYLAAPEPVPDTPSIAQGRALFGQIGCALCHTPTLRTGFSPIKALRNKPANLYSDLLLHHMGPGLADGAARGSASGDEFRTTPLWGVGQRIFFLNDGRARDLLQAIAAHASPSDAKYPASEANGVVDAFNALTEADKQSILDFLRSL